MLPYFTLPLLNIKMHTGFSLMVLCFIISIFIMMGTKKEGINKAQTLIIVGITSVLSFFGARLFHIIFERPELMKTMKESLSKFDGMTFYGAFILGSLVFFILTKLMIRNERKEKVLWDRAAISVSLTYFLMRVGCFASGCCWGSITAHPFHVQYFHPESVMPSLGIPVHPVQLYDAFLGLMLLITFVFLKKRRALESGALYYLFLIFYPIGRFITEGFRGDAFRGENIIIGLSMSQAISCVVFMIGLYLLLKRYSKKRIQIWRSYYEIIS